jgi:hypothetical protein
LKGFFRELADIGWWIAALVAGAAPRRLWRQLDPPFPVRRAAFPAGILTSILGFAIAVRGFFAFAGQLAGANNAWMLNRLVHSPGQSDDAVVMVPYGISILTLFIFLFFTPTGLIALYLMASGAVRGIAAFIDPDDARGDSLLSGIDWAATRMFAKRRADQARRTREREEGDEVPDVLLTGDAAGLASDYVVVASRRKAEWTAGAIVMTSGDWYKLGTPVDRRINGRLRTLYPLTKMEAVEVVRRGIMYELPRLSRRPAQNPQQTQT